MKSHSKIILIVLVLSSINIYSQSKDEVNEEIISVYININKEIWIENKKVQFDGIKKEIESIFKNRSLMFDPKLTYRVFADENLMLGFANDVENELLSVYNQDVKRERYLISTVDINLDGKNWFQDLKKN